MKLTFCVFWLHTPPHTPPLLFATLHNQAIKVNYALGLLRATKAGAVADGGPVTVTASYNAITGTRIAGNVQPEVKAKLTLDGRSMISGSPSC